MSKHENELAYDPADIHGDHLAMILDGMQVAVGNEIDRLYVEGCPVWDWKDGKLVDVSKELDRHLTGRINFILGMACIVTIPVLGAIFYFAAKPIFGFFMPFMTMLLSLMSVGIFGLGAWYGDKPTRQNCLVLIAVLLPALLYLVYWWLNGGFRFEF